MDKRRGEIQIQPCPGLSSSYFPETPYILNIVLLVKLARINLYKKWEEMDSLVFLRGTEEGRQGDNV